ncbi:hypothetical protein AAFF_G00353980 [Aldrovandia affinis]|uniref:Uncharacterized protein n=1 Tax=Aldrovandia affinis TaxID=143900 RepID=A0AAD7WN58_9TELE|nr:hypothetical protein AAFF_G00353980 [Aldrovandia affinis]
MNQRHAFRLELRDIWQIILVAIPKELLRVASDALKTGRIVERGGRDTEDDALERLKAELIELRGPVPTAWSKILDRKQGTKEPFEVYADRLWTLFTEYSGLEDANRDNNILLELLKNNAGPHVEQALTFGGGPAENTYRGIVEWATKVA